LEDNMFAIKHIMDPVSAAEGPRVWVEPVGLTRDLREWCRVEVLATELAPPAMLWEWYDASPGARRYELFRAAYRTWLLSRVHPDNLLALAGLTTKGRPITLLHQCADGSRNTASALRDVIEEVANCAR
jgi:uncharacterized protein YeaO (DUF488 family)